MKRQRNRHGTSSRVLGPRLRALAALALLCAAGCCGYQVGPRTTFRADVRTVYVPMFESDSLRRNLGERLTEAVVKEIETRTHYKVVAHPNADSVLSGRLVSDRKHVISEDINDLPRDIETEFVVLVSWYDRQGQMILQNAAFQLAPLNLSIGQSANFVPEAGQSLATAQQEAIQRLARQIVSQMEAGW